MPDPNPSDHWNSLASEIGADPTAVPPPPPPANQPPARPRTERPTKPKPAAPSGNWGELAGALGIEVPPEPEVRSQGFRHGGSSTGAGGQGLPAAPAGSGPAIEPTGPIGTHHEATPVPPPPSESAGRRDERPRHGDRRPRQGERSRGGDDRGRHQSGRRPERTERAPERPPRREVEPRTEESDDHFGFVEEVDEVTDIADVEFTEEGSAPKPADREGEPRRGRRRRRRRGGRGRDRDSAPRPAAGEPAEREGPGEAGEFDEAQPPIDADRGDEALSDEKRSDEPRTDEQREADDRSRRRRRRGGRRGRGEGGERAERRPSPPRRDQSVSETDDLEFIDEAEPEPQAIDFLEPANGDQPGDDEGDDADFAEVGADGDHEGKAAARDIPTWKEVIGSIIAVNMESRAKSPRGGGPPHRGRGGHGRGPRNGGGGSPQS